MFLVVAATSSTAVHQRIFREAHLRGVLCNIVDVPKLCDFYYPAVVQRGDLQIAVSTAGQSPALAQRLRQELELQFGTEYGSVRVACRRGSIGVSSQAGCDAGGGTNRRGAQRKAACNGDRRSV